MAFCDLFWPHVTLTFDLLIPKMDLSCPCPVCQLANSRFINAGFTMRQMRQLPQGPHQIGAPTNLTKIF